MRNGGAFLTIFKRELKSYFESPIAYVFLVVFLLLINALAFLWNGYGLYERGTADLEPFFFWVPLVYLILVPAATMGLWAEERRSGTIELLLTLPVTLRQAIIGKFLAAWSFMTIAVLLTFPVVLTLGFLGSPDLGVIAAGYVGMILMAGAYVAVGMLASALTRSQVISFVVSLIVCVVMVMAGTPFITNLFVRWLPAPLVDAVASFSFWTRFHDITRGVLDLRDIAYFASLIVFMLFATHVVLDNRKSA